ncbi:MAG: hypothetical protein R3348_10100 [Xanthomonadales bacterium]|nr:hypothetical protein [Xanthomonadales bacterium]
MNVNIALLVFLLGSTTLFAQEESQEAADEGNAAVEVAETDAQPEPEAVAEEAVSVMDRPLDGSSVDSFQAGLEQVEAEAGEYEYRRLMSALSFLLFYDIGVQRDKATLYSRLDGHSPNQILERVERHRKGKR